MHIRYITFAVAALTMGGVGLAARAQQKPSAVSRASSTHTVVVYKSPT